MRLLPIVLCSALSVLSAAEDAPADVTVAPVVDNAWTLADGQDGQGEGVAAERAYRELALRPPAEPIVVAVIDTGVDIAHEDLRGRIWENVRERDGLPGVDDDGNGYVDDLNGWNFLGSRDGQRQIGHATLEVTREYRRLLARHAEGPLPDTERAYFARVEKAYFAGKEAALGAMLRQGGMLFQLEKALGELRKAGLVDETREAIDALVAGRPDLQAAAGMAKTMLRHAGGSAGLRAGFTESTATFAHHYDPAFDEAAFLADTDGPGRGNPKVSPAFAGHGTHVAGIIAASRGNDLGIDGICDWVRIMPLVAVPNGDERDEDVAAAVRYAVDHGARIINCSFGKGFSPGKTAVDEAFRHAEAQGVLVVRAAGNEATDIDAEDGYPNPRLGVDGGEGRLGNWQLDGASRRIPDGDLVASFSNYGEREVDLFAPGVAVRSTVPGGYDSFSGSSMAAPHVAGVAALVWSQHPELRVEDLRTVLRQSARIHPGLDVTRPGTRNEKVPFAKLCATGGLVDAYAALRLLADRAAPP